MRSRRWYVHISVLIVLLFSGSRLAAAAADPPLSIKERPIGWLGVSIQEVGEELAERLAVTFGVESGTGVLVVEAIQGVRRVLKPDGKFIFFEHGLSPDPSVRRWQKPSEPLFRWAFEGCDVTRDIPSLLGKGGFNFERMDAGHLAPFPKSGSYCWWGVAHPEPRN